MKVLKTHTIKILITTEVIFIVNSFETGIFKLTVIVIKKKQTHIDTPSFCL